MTGFIAAKHRSYREKHKLILNKTIKNTKTHLLLLSSVIELKKR